MIQVGIYIKQIFTGVDQNLSFKRVATGVALLLFCIAFISNLYFKYAIDPNLVTADLDIIGVGLGSCTLDHFAQKLGPPS